MTLTTAPLTLTVSETEPSTGCLDGPANSADVSRVTGAPPPPDATEIRTQSASGSFNPTLTASVTASSSLASIASDEPQNMVSVPETSSLVATGGSTSAVDESAGSFVSSGQATMSSSATGISDNGRPAVSPNPSNINDDGEPAVSPSVSGAGGNGQSPASPGASGSSQLVSGAAPSTSLTGLPTSIGESGAPIPTTATISASGVSSVTDLSPDGPTLTETSLGDKSTSLAGAQASDSVGLYRPTGSLTGPNASNQNGTIALSAPSVDALKLSLFLKNLGVWVFNESRIVELSASNPREDTDDLASLVAAIGVQEQTQLRTLRTLLTQSGYPDVPPCRYDLPSNLTELSFLMVTLKSINLGVFMSMAEAADGPVAILLSSIASVDAKHIALLGDYSHRNASAQSFDTPATPAWAYNIALEYTQPGSCSVQLPLPLLPKLTINEKTAFHVQPGTNFWKYDSPLQPVGHSFCSFDNAIRAH
ncbi:uncharacterized protein SETTUDRAFT_28836 [Exserohilum turcica Et28A]|uniref:Uncharacterized protein n=1 Tax=Exserohilum turcicum (strain 28A) TaxID=671987 RepID=R0JY83_EXST2|nr:uncharacterized protein SETTUDRAFT_28836 [Exserohilum turcica Et28A]EOA85878.1 hypothetical protein SETTUDRAFT_28836 [Exserohilum turcica Et28A]